MSDELEREWSIGANTAGGVVGALVGAASAPVLGPFGVAAGALAGALAEDYVTRYAEDRARRVRSMAAAAAEEKGLTVDDLVAASLEDEHKRELLARAIQESARATEEHQIIGLARAFATGAISEDRAIVDESMVALETIGQLRGPHWRLVSILTRPSPSGESDHMNFRSGKPYALPWLRRDILEEDPGLAPVIDSLIAKLLGLGMIEDRARNVSDGRPRWALTGFGHACADYMRILGHNQAAS